MDETVPPPPVHERGEAAHRARLEARWRAGGELRQRLERDAPEIFRDGSTAERVAMLRVLRENGSPASDRLVAIALTELPDESGPRGTSVPAFVVSHLGRAGELRPAERRALRQAVREGDARLATSTRGRALRTLVETATEAELPAVSRLIEQETDPVVHAVGELALRLRRQGVDHATVLARTPESESR